MEEKITEISVEPTSLTVQDVESGNYRKDKFYKISWMDENEIKGEDIGRLYKVFSYNFSKGVVSGERRGKGLKKTKLMNGRVKQKHGNQCGKSFELKSREDLSSNGKLEYGLGECTTASQRKSFRRKFRRERKGRIEQLRREIKREEERWKRERKQLEDDLNLGGWIIYRFLRMFV